MPARRSKEVFFFLFGLCMSQLVLCCSSSLARPCLAECELWDIARGMLGNISIRGFFARTWRSRHPLTLWGGDGHGGNSLLGVKFSITASVLHGEDEHRREGGGVMVLNKPTQPTHQPKRRSANHLETHFTFHKARSCWWRGTTNIHPEQAWKEPGLTLSSSTFVSSGVRFFPSRFQQND